MKLNRKNFVIGITGGVGSGKSIALEILRNECGANVYQADRISRTISQKGQVAFDEIVALFGEGILMPDGNPDRNLIAHIVFENPEKLAALDAIIHPRVCEFLRDKAKEKEGLVVLEAALPREAHFPEICDEVWFIKSSRETRITRVMDARGYSREKACEIIASQLSDEEFSALSTRIILNEGSVEDFSRAVKNALEAAQSEGRV